MEHFGRYILLISVLFMLNFEESLQRAWVTTDECKYQLNI